jgi:hypothetical protein
MATPTNPDPALAPKPELNIAALHADLDQVMEAMAFNLGGGRGLSDYDLPRITIPTGGGTQWCVQSAEGEQFLPTLQCVIVLVRDGRVFWRAPFGEEARQPPDCASDDGVTGYGDPGGECISCPLNQFQSAPDGRSKACNEQKHIFILRGDSLLPEHLVIPPTSLKAARQYLLKLMASGLPYFKAVTEISLVPCKNAGGVRYSEARFQQLTKLDTEQQVLALKFHEFTKRLAVPREGRLAAAPTPKVLNGPPEGGTGEGPF